MTKIKNYKVPNDLISYLAHHCNDVMEVSYQQESCLVRYRVVTKSHTPACWSDEEELLEMLEKVGIQCYSGMPDIEVSHHKNEETIDFYFVRRERNIND